MDEALAIFLESFDHRFKEGLKSEQIPGAAVVIVKEGRVVYQKGFGIKEKGKPDMVDEDTVFRLGSLSKGFASVLAGIFVEEGIINWTDPVSQYLDEFRLSDPAQTERVEIRHLLSHTVGLPRHSYTNLVEDGLPLDRIIPRLEEVPLLTVEGQQLSYQNAAYSSIEKVLESQSNTDFSSLLKEMIFDPLSMRMATTDHQSILDSENKAYPHVMVSRSKGRRPIPITDKYYNAVSSGGINASISDMGKWLLLLLGHYPNVISPETLRDIYEPQATLQNRRFSRHWEGVDESHYALGWRVLENQGQTIVYHGGYVNGYRSELAFAPDEQLGICILINTPSSYPLKVIPELFKTVKADSIQMTVN
jgi:beta-lactamase class C